jgi:hypothetical protein
LKTIGADVQDIFLTIADKDKRIVLVRSTALDDIIALELIEIAFVGTGNSRHFERFLRRVVLYFLMIFKAFKKIKKMRKN